MPNNSVYLPLSGGLDLTTKSAERKEGTLIDCLNVEVDKNGGYVATRTEAPYDGVVEDLHIPTFYQVIGTQTGIGFSDGQSVEWANGAGQGTIYYRDKDDNDYGRWTLKPSVDSDLDGTTTTIYPLGSDGDASNNVVPSEPIRRFTTENIRRGHIKARVADGYFVDRASFHISSGTTRDLPDSGQLVTGLFTVADTVYAISSDTSSDLGGYIYEAHPNNGWQRKNMGQEFAFNLGEFDPRFERYIIWNPETMDGEAQQATNALDQLDYFPGRIMYWVDDRGGEADGEADDVEYWAEVEHVYRGDGGYYKDLGTTADVATVVPVNLDQVLAGDIIDGYQLVVNDLLLVKNQVDYSENGLYIVKTIPGNTVRDASYDTNEEIWNARVPKLINVTNGTENGGTGWFLTNTQDIDLGTSALIYAKDSLAEGALTTYGVFEHDRSTVPGREQITYNIAGLTESFAAYVASVDDPAGDNNFTDLTDESTTAFLGDIPVFTQGTSAAVGDYFLVGSHDEPTHIHLNSRFITHATGSYTLAYEYWNGSAWAALAQVNDPSSALSTGTVLPIQWTQPTSWAKTTINGKHMYFFRIRLASGSFTQAPLIDQVRVNAEHELAANQIPLSTTGGFGKWTEANAVNFTSGGGTAYYTPKVGDQLTDGTVQMTVLKVIVDSGSFAAGTATGTVMCGQMYGAATTVATSTQLGVIDEAAGGSIGAPTYTNVLTTANVVDDAHRDDIWHTTTTNVPVVLPTLAEMQETKTKYVYKEYNFAATDGSSNPTNIELRNTAAYLANGAGLGLKYDGERLVRIRTGAVVSQDEPRHVSIHGSQLAFGYGDGTLTLSVPGAPLNFRGSEGAQVFGYSKGVTGLARMDGETTAVFTKDTVHTLKGQFEAATQRELSDGNGAIEYTVSDKSGVIYTDTFGISTLAASEAYGDFSIKRMSRKVGPWLTPRLEGGGQDYWDDVVASTVTAGQGVDFALTYPSRNQYKLVFRDGYVLIMTLTEAGQGVRPEFTFQKLLNISTDASNTAFHTSFCQHTTSSGEEWAYYHNVNTVGDSGPDIVSITVRRLDWTPCHGPFAHGQWGGSLDQDGGNWMVIGPIFTNHPISNDRLAEAVLQGRGHGFYSVGTATYSDYEDITEMTNKQAYEPQSYNNRVLGTSSATYRDNKFEELYVPLQDRGRSFYVVVKQLYDVGNDTATINGLPFIFQSMMLSTESRRVQKH